MAQRALLIAGPTASGKTQMAIARAAAKRSLIINADAMQVYSVLDVITARPSRKELATVPHRMYGFIHPSIRYSAGAWLRAVDALIEKEGADAEMLVFVGGTGLYFDALLNGFADIPDVPHAVFQEVENLVKPLHASQRAELLAEYDPEMAARIRPADTQRVVRALSVMKATNRSLARWQEAPVRPSILSEYDVEKIILDPGRNVLRARIARRFESMMDAGAVGEVDMINALGLDRSLPAMRAIGVPELSAFLRGELSREVAVEKAIVATHQYAKRQRTWFRGRMKDWTRVNPLAKEINNGS